MSSLLYRLILLAGVLSMLSGCLSVQRHSSADPYVLHHHNWWNHYERGRLFLKDGNFAAARKDFETALGLIPGARYPYAMERWRARTYGMHMMEGYFPHRELGICLFELGEYQQALELLETSIQMEPSARAKFYINRSRKQLAQASAPPRFETAPQPARTRQREIVLKGTAIGSNPIESLIINGESEFIELASSHQTFERKLPLKEGPNVFRLSATDLAGRETTTNLTLTADWTPPQIHLQRSAAVLEISCLDSGGLGPLQVNDQTVVPSGTSYKLEWPLQSGVPLRLVAQDRAGNKVTWSLSEQELEHLAQNPSPAPPKLHVVDAGKTITLYNAEYVLDVRAEDDTALHSVSVNGENLLTRPTPLFRTLHRIALASGTNRLVVATEDMDNNLTEKHITVVYRKPEYLDRNYRLTTTLSPLAGDLPEPAYGLRVNHLIGHQLTKDPVRFYLLAGEEESRHLQEEQALSDSTLADPRALLKTGKQLNSDLVFITRVISDAPGQTIYTQVFDIHGSKELFIEDVYMEDISRLAHQLEGLVMKIEQRFPLLQARVGMQEKQLFIDAGEKCGAHTGMRLLVIRSEGSFEQGRIVRAEKQPIECIVSEVESETALFIIPGRHPEGAVRPGDFVFTR